MLIGVWILKIATMPEIVEHILKFCFAQSLLDAEKWLITTNPGRTSRYDNRPPGGRRS
jgi:hypothetical protein